MSLLLPTLFSDLRTVIAATWPEVVANKIWEATHADKLPYADMALPYAVIHIAEGMRLAQGWGLANRMYEVPVNVYYVGKVPDDPIDPLATKLELLRDAIDPAVHTLTHGQVLRVDSLSWDDALEINNILAAKNATGRAGQLTVTVLIGQNFTR